MKAKDKNAPAGNGKQKKQMLMLGSLVGVLAIVLFVQFGGQSPDEPPALAMDAAAGAPADPAAAAVPAAPVVAAAPVEMPPVTDNPVLNREVEGEGLSRSPFSSLWSSGQTVGPTAAEIAPPAVMLSATMPDGDRPLAVIDGELHFEGDTIQGWIVDEILPRRILLRSPSRAIVAVDMPLLAGSRFVPAFDG